MTYPKMPGMTDPDWTRYHGNNHHEVPVPRAMYGGSVRFARHLGKPLSAELWYDLVHRLGVTGICVYGWNDAEWTIGWGPGKVLINLDKEGNVADIDWSPWLPPYLVKEVASPTEAVVVSFTSWPPKT